MSRVRWTVDAANDLQHIVARIREDNRTAARNVAKTIYDGCRKLRDFPNRGRIGLVPDTRELVFAPWPYIAVYEVIGNEVQILASVTPRGTGHERRYYCPWLDGGTSPFILR